MAVRDWFQPPRQMLLVFLVVALASTAALGWLTWELLALDRDAESRRAQSLVEQAADGMSAALDRQLAGLERRLDVPSASDGALMPPGVALMTIREATIEVQPPGAFPFVPHLDSAPILTTTPWQTATRTELVAGNLAAALRAYRSLGSDEDPRIRAAALTRVARVERKLRRWPDALATYERLAALGHVDVEGMPARLVARVGRLAVFQATGDAAGIRAEASHLKGELERGELLVTRAQFDFYASEVARWTGTPALADAEAMARATAVQAVMRGDEMLADDGRRLVAVGVEAALVLWRRRTGADGLAVLALGPAATRSFIDAVTPEGMAWSITDPQTRVLVGTAPHGRQGATRPADMTGLPWTLQVFPIDPAVAAASPRRLLLLAVLVSVAAMVFAGWYFIWRGITREIRVARLQSDFVAAVSHEFRSPLTSLGHIAELLTTGRMGSEERKQRSYELLRGQATRLSQLVEGLLDFKKLQEGEFTFRFEDGDPAAIVHQVVSDFQRQLDGEGRRVDLRADQPVPPVRLDREAFGRALWNLLDNAVKYSPASARVEVSVSRDRPAERVAITVKDEGPGIPADEQGRIFERFVRGAGARAGRIRGTGIGLAMAREIVRAHGGELTVASTPGAGSAFTIALPSQASERTGA